jgi:hypothetical protein
MHTYARITNITLLALCYSMFVLSKGHPQGVRPINFHNQINKMFSRCKIRLIAQRVLCYGGREIYHLQNSRTGTLRLVGSKNLKLLTVSLF